MTSKRKQTTAKIAKLYTKLIYFTIIGNICATIAQLTQFRNVTNEIPFVGSTSEI
jgi:hypothetical protein